MISNEIASTNRPPTNTESSPPTSTSARSKDDEVVDYLFQRPEVEHHFNGKRWGNDNFLEQARTVSDIEREFHSMSFAEKNNVSGILIKFFALKIF